MGYAKLFDSLWSGSLYGQFNASAVFMVLLSLADKDGQIDMTTEAIAGRTGWPIEFIQEGIRQLEAPDPRSRTPDADGRRIIRLSAHRDWGWFVTNHDKYREEERSAERREYLRVAKRKERDAARQQASTNVNMSTDQIRADQSRSDQKKVPTEPMSNSASASIAAVFEHWRTTHGYPRAKLDEKRRALIRKALATYSEADLCQSISGYLNSPHHMGRNDSCTKYTDLGLLLRDAQRIDAGLKFYTEPPRTDVSALTRKNIDATADWVPPEMRRAAV